MKKESYRPLSAEHDFAGSCPACSYQMEAVSGLTSECPPGPGMFTVCFACGEILQFGADMKLIQPPKETIFELLVSEAGKIVLASQDYIRQRRAAGDWIPEKPTK